MPSENSEEFIGFNPRPAGAKPQQPKTPDSIQYSSPTSKQGEITGFNSLFLWGGIPIALIGFINFMVFMVGVMSTIMAYLKIKSEADFGNEVAKQKQSSSKMAVWIIGIMIPIRFLFLVMIGI